MGEHKKEKRSKKAAKEEPKDIEMEDVPQSPAVEVADADTATETSNKGKKAKKERKEKRKQKDAELKPKTDEEAAPAEKKEKKDKKRKRSGDEEEEVAPPTEEKATEEEEKPKKKKSKKDKSEKSEKKDKKSKSKSTETNGEAPETTKPLEEAEEDKDEAKSGKNSRFICFIGNLPFTATTNAVKAHFSSLEPTSVRLLTEKDNPKKSRGIAFIEFASYDKMKTCLSKFHHSEFNDNVSPARKINVELTAGGGGKKSVHRNDKIKQKNAKLNEERLRKMHEEEAAKLAKGKKKDGEEPKKEAAPTRDESDDIHPSRRAWVPHRKN